MNYRCPPNTGIMLLFVTHVSPVGFAKKYALVVEKHVTKKQKDMSVPLGLVGVAIPYLMS